jgi:putative transposase
MPRASRYHLPGYIWHITHRCHRRQFLLKFARDRRAWAQWLFEARKRYGLCVLDYTVTCNHIHLLALDQDRNEIARSMQLIAGRSAQAHQRRKDRNGAFWEDRYHATAVDSGEYLARCLVYVDLNMVRAGVVDHPTEWETSGYHEIQAERVRYRIVDRGALANALGLGSTEDLAATHAGWIGAALATRMASREPRWSESVAVGRLEFVERVAAELGTRALYWRVQEAGDGYVLRESPQAYCAFSVGEIEPLSSKSTCSWP